VFVGHLGAGLAAKALEPRLSLGALFAAALLADLALWTLVLADVESVGPPVTAGGARFFTFAFPWSHGALASVAWSALAGALAWIAAGPAMPRRGRLAATIAAVVASHFVLDAVVHVREMPLAGPASPKVGFGLWQAMPIALAIEGALALAALAAYLAVARPTRGRGIAVAALVATTGTLTAVGPWLPGDPPAPAALALSSLATLALVVVAGAWVDRSAGLAARPTPPAADGRL
jgi:hypothetical protein